MASLRRREQTENGGRDGEGLLDGFFVMQSRTRKIPGLRQSGGTGDAVCGCATSCAACPSKVYEADEDHRVVLLLEFSGVAA